MVANWRQQHGRGLAVMTWLWIASTRGAGLRRCWRLYCWLGSNNAWLTLPYWKMRTMAYIYLRYRIIFKASEGAMFLSKIDFNFEIGIIIFFQPTCFYLKLALPSLFNCCASFTTWLLSLQPNVHSIKRTSHFGRTCWKKSKWEGGLRSWDSL